MAGMLFIVLYISKTIFMLFVKLLRVC